MHTQDHQNRNRSRLESQQRSYTHWNPFYWKILKTFLHFEDVPEMHDRILVIQANRLGVAMITKDESIQKANVIEIIWN